MILKPVYSQWLAAAMRKAGVVLQPEQTQRTAGDGARTKYFKHRKVRRKR